MLIYYSAKKNAEKCKFTYNTCFMLQYVELIFRDFSKVSISSSRKTYSMLKSCTY